MDLKELQLYLPDKPAKMTIYSWVQQGKIPVQKGSKKLTFLRSEIDEWLLNGRSMKYKAELKLKKKKAKS
ncbi:MAG: helix-turn-helix domain-containing protein [Saprospiraceae bacterium]|nr:helix-turn-helix domain-containing protein [Candidatus Brachybacter algidus]